MPDMIENSAGATAIRPFTIPEVPEAELKALRERIADTRWPNRELIADRSQGVQLATIHPAAVQHPGHDRVDHRSSLPIRPILPPCPIVNGSTTDFTHPFAMITHGNPAHKRFPQIKVERLRGNPDNVRISQLLGANILN